MTYLNINTLSDNPQFPKTSIIKFGDINKYPLSVQIDTRDVTVVLEDDGTQVSDNTFFQQLPAQIVLVFLKPGEHWGGGNSNKQYTISQVKVNSISSIFHFHTPQVQLCPRK